MQELLDQIEHYKKEMAGYAAADEQQAEDFRIKYLGTKGIVKSVMGAMKDIPPEKKKERERPSEQSSTPEPRVQTEPDTDTATDLNAFPLAQLSPQTEFILQNFKGT